MDIAQYLPILIILATVGTVAYLKRGQAATERPAEPRAKPVLSPKEAAFFEKLSTAIMDMEGVFAFPKVCLSAFISNEHDGTSPTECIDFVIVDTATNVLLVIEFEAASSRHGSDHSPERLAAADIPTLRLPAAGQFEVSSLRQAIRETIPLAA